MASPLSVVVWSALALLVGGAVIRDRRAALGVRVLELALLVGCLAGVLGAWLGAPKT